VIGGPRRRFFTIGMVILLLAPVVAAKMRGLI